MGLRAKEEPSTKKCLCIRLIYTTFYFLYANIFFYSRYCHGCPRSEVWSQKVWYCRKHFLLCWNHYLSLRNVHSLLATVLWNCVRLVNLEKKKWHSVGVCPFSPHFANDFHKPTTQQENSSDFCHAVGITTGVCSFNYYFSVLISLNSVRM